MDEKLSESLLLKFDLSATEVDALGTLLEYLLFSADPQVDLNTLENVYQKLNDESFLATWKRENVSLELSLDEIVEVNKALHYAGGSALSGTFQLTGELRCCLISAPFVDRVYRAANRI